MAMEMATRHLEKKIVSLHIKVNWQIQLYPKISFKGIRNWYTGPEIATDTVANATNTFSLETKNYSLVAKVATRCLYDLDLN